MHVLSMAQEVLSKCEEIFSFLENSCHTMARPLLFFKEPNFLLSKPKNGGGGGYSLTFNTVESMQILWV